MEHTLQSPTVQKALPDLASLDTTLGFDGFLASPPPTVTADPKSIREHLRGYAVQLERHERFTEIWKHQVCTVSELAQKLDTDSAQYNNQLVNLRQLITTLDARCQEVQQSPVTGYARQHDLDKSLLGLPEFEDLYYFLACKTRTLYSDLQIRFSSNFIHMDDILHHRGSSSYAHEPCSVRDIRNFLRAVWFHLLHPVIVRAIEASINHRKYQTLKANPLLPTWNMEDLTPQERESMSHFQLGLNLDVSTMGTMFEHLEDVSAMSVPALLMKVSQKGLGIKFAPSQDSIPGQRMSKRGSQAMAKAWMDLAGGNDEHYAKPVVQSGMHDAPEYARELYYDFNEVSAPNMGIQTDLPTLPAPVVQPVDRHVNMIDAHMLPGASHSNNVHTWLPNILQHEVQSPLPSMSSNYGIHRLFHPQSPGTSKKSGNSLPSTPSHYRMLFHGSNEFRHKPPTPPPKSPTYEARVRQLEVEIRERMQRDSSRLENALQQVEVLQRENSQLQERLSMTSPPRGLFRRLSKAGTKSPRKSPRRSILHGVTK
jgi:hypothetical protein